MADTQEVVGASARVTLGEAITEKGIMIAIKTTDAEAYKAADTENLIVIGVTEEVGSEGDVITAYAGKFLLDNSTNYPVTKAYINQNCYVEDEKTVSIDGGSNSRIAGVVIDVVTEGVWVAVGVQ